MNYYSNCFIEAIRAKIKYGNDAGCCIGEALGNDLAQYLIDGC